VTESALSLRALTRRFRTGGGVIDIDLDVHPGEVHALVGLNGAGKSTLMRLALGMLRPEAGAVAVLGTNIAGAASGVWSRVGHLVEYPLAYGELTGRANLEMSAKLHGLTRRAVRPAVEEVLDELNLRRYADVRTSRLSLGNRQRLGLAAALLHRPALIVLDEPTNALDPSGVLLLRKSLLRRAEEGAAILVSSHHLDEVARIAERITVINEGRIIGRVDPTGVDIERAFFALVQADSESRGETATS
jgi:ABC-2 type transport system ATP-binding protein